MLQLIKRGAVVALAMGSSCVPQVASAGENGHPTLSAIGRYLGVGYSHKGYQTSPGNLNVVRRLHPASEYPSSRLLLPYHASNYSHANHPTLYPQTLPMGMNMPAGQNAPSKPASPPKPTGPTPTWLEPYLEDVKSTPEVNEVDSEGPSVESSPSDRDDTLLLDSAGNIIRQPAKIGDAESSANPRYKTAEPAMVNRYRQGMQTRSIK